MSTKKDKLPVKVPVSNPPVSTSISPTPDSSSEPPADFSEEDGPESDSESPDPAKESSGAIPPLPPATSISSSKSTEDGFSTDFHFMVDSECNNDVNVENIIIPRSTKITPQQAENVIAKFAEKQNLDNPRTALVAVCILLQSGGTARGCDGNLSCTISDHTFKLSQLRGVLNESKLKSCERKLARTLAEPISRIAYKYGIDGNLAKKIIRAHPERNFTPEETVYLSDFQADNPDCPEILRRYIMETFESRRPKSSTSNPPKGKGSGRKGRKARK